MANSQVGSLNGKLFERKARQMCNSRAKAEQANMWIHHKKRVDFRNAYLARTYRRISIVCAANELEIITNL